MSASLSQGDIKVPWMLSNPQSAPDGDYKDRAYCKDRTDEKNKLGSFI
jgi:hypothetical protein